MRMNMDTTLLGLYSANIGLKAINADVMKL